ncbi:MAG: PD-(D/E)XK nuclease family protein, partial [Oscillospiraceae bacterium]
IDKFTSYLHENEKNYNRELKDIFNILIDIFDMIYDSLNDDNITVREYIEIFTLVCKNYDYKKIPQCQDDIIYTDVKRAVLLNPKIIFVLGANMGSFPNVDEINSLISKNDRTFIVENGYELIENYDKLLSDQYFYCYKALTGASEKVFVTFEGFDINGEQKTPSKFITNLQRDCINFNIVTKDDFKKEYFIYDDDTAFNVFCDNYKKDDRFTNSLNSYLKSTNKYERFIDTLFFNINSRNYYLTDKNVINQIYTDNIKLSPSKLDIFQKCRFLYFLKNSLNISQRKKAEISYSDLGNFVHYIVYKIINDLGDDFYNLPENDILTFIEKMSDSYIEKYYGENKINYDYQYLLNIIKNDVFHLILNIQKELNFGEFKVIGVEVSIDDKSEIKPYKRVVESKTVEIGGVVDRVDVCCIGDKKYIRVIDYKTSNKSFDYGTFYNGIDMQLLIYLFTLAKSDNEKYKNAIPSAAFYMPAKVDVTYLQDKKEIYDSFTLNGIMLNKLEVLSGMGGKDNTYLKKYYKLNKTTKKLDSDFLLDEKEFNLLENHINNIVDDTIYKMLDGDIRYIPFKDDKIIACEYCDYKKVCKIEEDDEFNNKVTNKKDEILKLILGEENETKLD